MGMSRGETKGDGDPHTLESLQKQVDGSYIETIRLGAGIVLITDEEGKLNGSKPMTTSLMMLSWAMLSLLVEEYT